MSEPDYFQPHVYLAGKQLNESANLQGMTPVADISIKWGARNWYGEIEPSTARLLILDPYGDLLHMKSGAEVKITLYPRGKVLWQGTLDEATFVWTVRRDAAGNDVPMWEVEITAYDALGLMAGDRKHGPTYVPRNGQQNTLHWGRCLISERFRDLAYRAPLPLIAEIDPYWEAVDEAAILPPTAIFPVAPYTTQQNVSVLHVLRKSARILHILNRPYVDHESGTIRLARPPLAKWTAGTVTPTGATGQPLKLKRTQEPKSQVIELPARTLEAVNALQLSLNPEDYLTHARAIQRREELQTPTAGSGYVGTHYDVFDAPGHTVTIWQDRESVSSVELETDLSAGYVYGDYFSEIAELIEYTRNWQTPPPFRVHIGKTYPTDGFAAATYFLRAQPYVGSFGETHAAFAMVGSPLQWGGKIPHFAIVGGELRYTAESGWVVECYPAPLPTKDDSEKTLADFPTVSARIDSADPDLTVGDFQLI